ncbi:hypothetical protein AURDEDRAFT_174136 [Auricularia subglabra TFB-10046 SS5]|nr:hypothetical protein AURDEDRAFT_174136 [Auricularia subglabra TFB-10046 SS5]
MATDNTSTALYNKRMHAVVNRKHVGKIWPDVLSTVPTEIIPWIIFRTRPLLEELLALPQKQRLKILKVLMRAAGLSACRKHAGAADVILRRLVYNGAEPQDLTPHRRRCAIIELATSTRTREPVQLALRLNKMLGKEDNELEAIFA